MWRNLVMSCNIYPGPADQASESRVSFGGAGFRAKQCSGPSCFVATRAACFVSWGSKNNFPEVYTGSGCAKRLDRKHGFQSCIRFRFQKGLAELHDLSNSH